MKRVLATTVVLLSGCLSAPAADLADHGASPPSLPESRVVVGVADSGINPYHAQFADPEAQLPDDFADARTGEPPIPIRLATQGSFEERFAADKATWDQVEPERLYWFVGTRILGISFATGAPYVVDTERFLPHGTGVASVVRSVSPSAWIVMVQGNGSAFSDPPVLGAFQSIVRGVAWASEQPWIDVISLSIGMAVDVPHFWEMLGYTAATRQASESGKLVVNSAGNYPLTDVHGTSGPPWVISVGGALSAAKGEALMARKVIDVVADYWRVVAAHEPEEWGHSSGTSFAAPAVAGNLAQAILALRTAAHHSGGIRAGVLCECSGLNLSGPNFREALNASAIYWNTTDWDPRNATPSNLSLLELKETLPIGPAPWVQMGWGHVGDSTWTAMVAHLQGSPLPAKSAEARAYMGAYQAAREAYWSKPG